MFRYTKAVASTKPLKRSAQIIMAITVLTSLFTIGKTPLGSTVTTQAATLAGAPRYQVYNPPAGLGTDAGEPSIGVNWSTGNVMFQASLQALRVSFNDATSPAVATWVDKSAPNAVVSLDPILFTDSRTGRTLTSQLTGQDSLSAYTDDDGENWTPAQGGGINSGVDHQTMGGGAYAPGLGLPLPVQPYQRAVYYCSQDIAAAFCARSDDGGLTFGPGVPIYTAYECNGLHGHVKVSPDGTVYVPNNNCGYVSPLTYSGQGAVVSRDNGITWKVYQVVDKNNPSVVLNPGDSDPSIGVGAGGRVYFGAQNKVSENGVVNSPPYAAVSDDNGQTWRNLQRIGTEFGIKNAVFPAVVAGDNDRAAFAFLGTSMDGDYTATGVFPGVWHLYVASTFDGGQTWSTIDATPNDPVQRGSICTGGTTCGSDRNLLDFIDLQVDAQGRALAAFADGCIGGCVNGGANSFSALASIARQSGGKRLFAKYDPTEPAAPAAPLLKGTRDSSGIRLTWQAPDNGGSDITGYRVYRGTAPGAETFLASTTSTSYNDTSVVAGTAYYYKVSAVNSVGEGARSNEVNPVLAVAQNPCALPGALVVTDDTDNAPNTPPDTSVDVKKLYVAEPYYTDGSNKLVFTLKTAGGALPPSSQWYILWNRATPDSNADRNYVAMKTDATGAVSYEYGQISPPSVNLPTRLGPADAGSYDAPTGTVQITVADSKLDNIQAGKDLSDIQVRTFYVRPDGAVVTQSSSSDYSPMGLYTLVGNASCRPPSTGLPDLVITALSASQDRPGQTTIAATVANTGSANASNVVIRFNDDSTLIGNSGTVMTLAQGASTTLYITWNTRSINGDHVVTAIADPSNKVAESNESNNQLSRTITIRGNKVSNGSYEQSSGGGPTAWSGTQGTAYNSSATNSSDGTHSVSATGNGGPATVLNPAWTSAPIAVTPGQAYNLSMTVSTSDASTAPAMQVVYLDAVGNVLNTTTGISTSVTGTSVAKLVLGKITVPQGVSSVRLKLLGFSPTDLSTGGTVYFDDVWLW